MSVTASRAGRIVLQDIGLRGFGFPSTERLRLRRETELLFSEGSHTFSFPIRCRWLIREAGVGERGGIRFMPIAAKRRFPRAVDRNRVKRSLREAYRLSVPGLRMRLEESGFVLLLSCQGIDAAAGELTRNMKAMSRIVKDLESALGAHESAREG